MLKNETVSTQFIRIITATSPIIIGFVLSAVIIFLLNVIFKTDNVLKGKMGLGVTLLATMFSIMGIIFESTIFYTIAVTLSIDVIIVSLIELR